MYLPFLGAVHDIEHMKSIYQHDRAFSFRSATIKAVVGNVHYLRKISDADLRQLERLLLDKVRLYRECDPLSEELLSKVNKVYGGTPDVCTKEGLAEYVNGFAMTVNTEVKRREQNLINTLPSDQSHSSTEPEDSNDSP